jgi:predicted Zn-dependent peptidase
MRAAFRQRLEFLSAYTNSNRDPSLLDVYARVKDADRVEQVLAELAAAAARARDELVDAGRLEDLKQRMRYGFLMQLDTPDSVASAFARAIAIDGDLTGIETLFATYASLTPEDIRDAARAIFVDQRRTTGVLRASA